jgi:hypothetical protein
MERIRPHHVGNNRPISMVAKSVRPRAAAGNNNNVLSIGTPTLRHACAKISAADNESGHSVVNGKGRLIDPTRRLLTAGARFEIGREHDLGGKLVAARLALLLG